MRTPKEEREITAGGYVWNEDGTRADRMEVYCSDYGYMAKLDRYVKQFPEIWKVERVEKSGDDVASKTYSCPARCISFLSGKRIAKKAAANALTDAPGDLTEDEDT